MINGHLIKFENNNKELYLFFDFSNEFSLDFDFKITKKKVKKINELIIEYIKNKNINFDTGKIFIVASGVVLQSLFINNYQFIKIPEKLNNNYQYTETINIENEQIKSEIQNTIIESKEMETNIIKEPINKNEKNLINESNILSKEPQKAEIKNKIISETNKQAINNITKKDKIISNEPTTSPPINDVTKTEKIIENESTTSPPVINVPKEQQVTIYRSNGIIENINLEEYVIGVVSAEMPAAFNIEALKAQSVLARTYALKKIKKNEVIADSTSNQVYKDINQLKKVWGNDFNKYYIKIKEAVLATKGEVLLYNNDYIEAVYHSTSNGLTEDSTFVWGNYFPYLKSVDSHWDKTTNSFLKETLKDYSELEAITGISFNNAKIEILSKTVSNRINKIKINDTIFSGIELRMLLGLRSTDFDVKLENEKVVFITRGYGHGVGMSQYGANGMAKEGYSYQEILLHYYPNTQLKK